MILVEVNISNLAGFMVHSKEEIASVILQLIPGQGLNAFSTWGDLSLSSEKYKLRYPQFT